MQLENWLAAIDAVAVYEDAVLAEMRQFAQVCLENTDTWYDTAVLERLLAEDRDRIGRDCEEPCWQHAAIRSAIETYKENRDWDAARELLHAMLRRSYSWEQSFC